MKQDTTAQFDLNEQLVQRQLKLSLLRTQGNTFPNDFRKDAFATDLLTEYGAKTEAELEQINHSVKLAGRLVTCRLMGKVAFIQLQDMTGRIQIYVKQELVSVDAYNCFKQWDLGDIIAVEGLLFKTKTNELSVRANQLRLLTKSLRPLPDKYHGLTDQELCYRQRYIDLIANETTRRVFKIRSLLITTLREFFIARRFLEVETPMLHPIPGGAAARPFITHHNALSLPLYLRIAPELYLKRLVVGGFERVFEINRNFRNEGLSTRHSPEFTMLEFYQAYIDYKDLMDLTQTLLYELAQKIFGCPYFIYQGHTLDFSKPINRMTVKEAVLQFNPTFFSPNTIDDLPTALAVAQALTLPCKAEDGLGKILYAIFEKTVEHQLIEPIFITEFPTEVSPLARRNDTNPTVTDRFELFIAGREIANGFSELNDAQDQAARFEEQLKERNAGDDEAMVPDYDYIKALEQGLPPTAGEGIGIDRLVMLFTDKPSIRDVILFPQMRPTHSDA